MIQAATSLYLIGLYAKRLIQCSTMADWRQIQARIRKAKNSPEALTKLAQLFARTRDAMVAWELALIEEKAGRNEEAGKWYGLAAQRFRRSDWKKKAEEALARLGFPVPAATAELAREAETIAEETREREHVGPAVGEIVETEVAEESVTPQPGRSDAAAPAEPLKRGRRRGRRGGRGRRRRGAAAAPGLPSQAFAEPATTPATTVDRQAPVQRFERPKGEPAAGAESYRPEKTEAPEPMLPSERMAHGRAGDPALASRLAQLESKLRRLLSSPLHRLDQTEEAPAGPGVFLLSDSDQIHSYYIEACQTLRVGIGNLVRGGRGGGRGGRGRGDSETGLRARLAEHLEINEAKVSQYLKDHCVVRWIQLDDDAPHLAHFAIAILRTPLNVD
jgi:hypothetical protein